MAHMWTALAATGVLGLLFGWAVRGLGLRGKLRRAEGERNIAVGTLQEKENELEALYAAGRTPSTSEGIAANDDELRKELQEREEKLQNLSDELARSKAELNELRVSGGETGAGEVVSAAAVGAAVAGIASNLGDDSEAIEQADGIDEDEASLAWRNRYLESQVRTLQDKVQELSAVGAVPVDSSDAELSDASDLGSEERVSIEKLKWQNDYLRQRLSFFETGEGELPTEEAAQVEEQDTEDVTPGASDEEIAKLRWRNRYLEGRLAYYEGDKGEEESGSDESGIVGLAAGAAIAATALADKLEPNEDVEEVALEAAPEEVDNIDFDNLDLDSQDEEALEEQPDSLEEVSAEDQHSSEEVEDVSEEVTETPDDSDEEEHSGKRPLALEGPVNGEGDDLTAIGGIGPKIEKVLNELGIYHYDQIAEWSPENIEWVDEHLAFQGRIEREQWVQQASSLAGEPAE